MGVVFIVRYYANAQEKKQLQILSLGDEEEGVDVYTWIFVNKKNYYEYDNIK